MLCECIDECISQLASTAKADCITPVEGAACKILKAALFQRNFSANYSIVLIFDLILCLRAFKFSK